MAGRPGQCPFSGLLLHTPVPNSILANKGRVPLVLMLFVPGCQQHALMLLGQYTFMLELQQLSGGHDHSSILLGLTSIPILPKCAVAEPPTPRVKVWGLGLWYGWLPMANFVADAAF